MFEGFDELRLGKSDIVIRPLPIDSKCLEGAGRVIKHSSFMGGPAA
jgi:hypothetical protein